MASKWIARAAIAVALLGVGAAIGMWVSMKRGAPPPTWVGVRAQPDPDPEQPADLAGSVTGPGAVTHQHVTGERLVYELSSHISGAGIDMMESSDIALHLNADIHLFTQDVDESGNADMVLTFHDVNADGVFMDSTMNLYSSDDRTLFETEGEKPVDTKLDPQATSGIPQLEFFKEPIRIKVAPDGRVLEVSGAHGLSDLLMATPAMSHTSLPRADVEEGGQWESGFRLPLPGFGTPVDARILNTLLRREYVGERLCVVIRQEFGAYQEGGSLQSPESAQGEAMEFGIPIFDLRGEGLVHVDANRGQLLHNQFDLQLTFAISSFVDKLPEPAADIVAQFGQIFSGHVAAFDDLLGGDPSAGDPMESLELRIDIQGSMSLVEAL